VNRLIASLPDPLSLEGLSARSVPSASRRRPVDKKDAGQVAQEAVHIAEAEQGSGLRCASCGAVWTSESARQLVAREGECLACGGAIQGPEIARIRELLRLGEHLATVAELALHRPDQKPAMLREAVSSWRAGAG
jgi:hypothetical protein